MDFSACDISAILPPDDFGAHASDSKSSFSDGENTDDPLPDDLEVSFVEESFEGIQFARLLPTAYKFESFHVGLLVRYADHDKDRWHWAVVSNVGDVAEDGLFDIYFRLCGNVDPTDNGVCVRFPEGFYELLIDDTSFQHKVTNLNDLAVGDHIRFFKPSSNEWNMG